MVQNSGQLKVAVIVFLSFCSTTALSTTSANTSVHTLDYLGETLKIGTSVGFGKHFTGKLKWALFSVVNFLSFLVAKQL